MVRLFLAGMAVTPSFHVGSLKQEQVPGAQGRKCECSLRLPEPWSPPVDSCSNELARPWIKPVTHPLRLISVSPRVVPSPVPPMGDPCKVLDTGPDRTLEPHEGSRI